MKLVEIYSLFLISIVNTSPIKEANNEANIIEGNNEISNTSDIHVDENELELESRAGVLDNLNPLNVLKPAEQPDKNKADGQSNNPFEGIQSFFNNVPQFFNGSNPFGQLFSSPTAGNFLDNIKVFLVGSQGMVMPASAMFSGLQNIMQALGNAGSFLQKNASAMFGGLQNIMQTLGNAISFLHVPTLPSEK